MSKLINNIVYNQVMKMLDTLKTHSQVENTYVMIYADPETTEDLQKINIVIAERVEGSDPKILKRIPLNACQWYGFSMILDLVKEGVIDQFLKEKT